MSEPITVEEFKDYVRVTSDAEDDVIAMLIVAAREQLEHETDRTLVAKTGTLYRAAFPCSRRWLELPRPVARSVASVSYVDAAGATQTFAAENYTVLTATEPARIHLVPSADWPATQDDNPHAVTITYAAGYADPANDCPRKLKLGVLWLAAWFYEQRLHVNIGNIINALPDHLGAIIGACRTYLIYQAEITSVTFADLDGSATGDLINLSAITGLTGGGATKLDGLSTALHGVDTIVILSFGDAAQWWKLRALGLGEVEDGASLVVPDDDATLAWVRIL